MAILVLNLLYATEVEWRQGATLLAQQIEAQAAERQITGAQGLVTSKSSAKDKLSLFRSLFVGRGDHCPAPPG